MKAQIIIIGDELLNGSIQDKNIQPLTHWLDGLGFECNQILITKDREDLLLAAMESAWEKADLVISTGGLGPTKDDITKQVMGKLTQSSMKEDPNAEALVRELYARRGKEWHRELNHYHILPEKVQPFDNPKGFAPGLMIKDQVKRKLFLATPGVPRELFAMIEETLPQLIEEFFPQIDRGDKVVTLRTYGVPEEVIFNQLCPGLWEELEKYGKVSSLPQIMGVDIHIKLHDHSDYPKKREAIIDHVNLTALKENIWAYEFKLLEEVIVEKAAAKNLKIGFAESCTGGLVAHRITNVAGSSQIFMGSLVTYSNEAKMSCLGVLAKTLDNWGAVSEQTASEMALGAREKLNLDIALSLTGIAGPGGGTEEKPVGTVCIGVATANENTAKRYNYVGDRELLKQRFAQAALMKALKIIDSF